MASPRQARSLPVTTASQEAREHFELGRLAAFRFRFERARPLFDAALAADPDFALAYIYRGAARRAPRTSGSRSASSEPWRCGTASRRVSAA